MSPRKRIRTNPTEIASLAGVPEPTAASRARATLQASDASAASTMARISDSSATSSVTETSNYTNSYASLRESKTKNRSWYGSWPRVPKSAASTQLAKETIHGGTLKPGSAPDFSRFNSRKPGDSTNDADTSETPTMLRTATVPTTTVQTAADAGSGGATTASNNDMTPPLPEPGSYNASLTTNNMDTVASSNPDVKEPAPSVGWFSWLSRSAPDNGKQQEGHAVTPRDLEEDKDEVSRLPSVESENTAQSTSAPDANQPETSSGMLSYFWPSTSKTGPAALQTTTGEQSRVDIKAVNTKDAENQNTAMNDTPPDPIPMPAANQGLSEASAPASASAGSTWAFWSRDTRPKVTGKQPDSPERGEIAVIGEQSEAHPTPAMGVDVREPSSKPSSVKEATPKDAVSKKKKRLRPQSMETNEVLSTSPTTSKSDTSVKRDGLPSKQADLSPGQVTTSSHNIVFPSFQSTYRLKENPSILQQIAQFLLRTQQPPPKHVFLTKDTPRVRKAVAIGVHGLFPAAYLRPMIGQPTGTSIRFANHGADAIRCWADSHGCQDCKIEKIALEGEGKIADRVENLWKLLLNWIDHIRTADLIILACHSQGVPVALMLLAKLIDLGIVTTTRIGVCAMAGVSLGPFPDYKSGLGMLMGSASELWDFSNPESDVTKRHAEALRIALEYGARITYVGSIDDQVVPLESAVFSPVYHPYVYRAVFVDGRIHTPDFIAHLVGFACKLRNLGISDHGLIRELSVPLAGSLYSGEGHSRLYDDPQVYDLALSHALETTDVGKVSCDIKRHEGLSSPNPYHLPWIMRGLLEEDFVKTDLHSETAGLLKQFDEWKPVTKALKDVKYRLEAVRSKL